MKRTLRVLFLAVMAMALMVSGAFAANTSVDLTTLDGKKTVEVTLSGDVNTAEVSVHLSLDIKSKDASVALTVESKDKTGYVGVTLPSDTTTKQSGDKEIKIKLLREITEDNLPDVTFKIVATVSGDKKKESADVSFTVKLVKSEEVVESPDISDIAFDPEIAEIELSEGTTAKIHIEVTLSDDSDTAPKVASEPAGNAIATAGDVKLSGSGTDWSGDVVITTTATEATTTTIKFIVTLGNNSKDEDLTVNITNGPTGGGYGVVVSVEPDFDSVDIDLNEGTEETVNFTITLSSVDAWDGAEPVLTPTYDESEVSVDVGTVEATDEDRGLTYSVTVTITAIATETTTAYIDFKATVTSTDETTVYSGDLDGFEVRIAAATNSEPTSGAAWYGNSPNDIMNGFALYIVKGEPRSVDKTIAIIASSDVDVSDAIISIVDTDGNEYTGTEWEYTPEAFTATDTTDDAGTVYSAKITFTPKAEMASTDYTFSIVMSGDAVSVDMPSDFTFTLSVISTDKDPDEEGNTGTLKALTANSTDVRVKLEDTVDIVLTVDGPYLQNVYKFAYEPTALKYGTLSEAEVVDSAVHVSANNTATYKYKASAVGTETITFSVTSGDDTANKKSVPVNITVYVDTENPVTPEKPSIVAPKELEALGYSDLLDADGVKDAFTNKGRARWAMRAAGPVAKHGWLLRFWVSAVLNYFAREGGDITVAWVSLKDSAVSIAGNASADEAIKIDEEVSPDRSIAVFDVDVAKLATGLDNGQNFQVQPSYVLQSYADNGVTGGEAAYESVGTVTGEYVAPDPDPGKIDTILGGSSGGCDAGFGALALALAATLFLGKKRS